MRYYILENSDRDGEQANRLEVHGPYPSLEHCRQWILEEAKRLFAMGSDTVPGADTEWGSRYTIVEALETLRPVPVVSVRWQLRKESTK